MRKKLRKNQVLLVIILLLLVSNTLAIIQVFGAQLTNREVTVSDSRINITNVTYTHQWTGSVNTLRCFRVLFCTTSSGPCNTPAGLSTAGTSKGTWSGLTAGNWNLDATTNGTLELTNVAGENPLANVSLEFLGITNPSNQATYFNRITTYSDVGCITEVDSGVGIFTIINSGLSVSASIPGPLPPGGGGGGGPTGRASVVFKGRAYPQAFLTLLRNDRVAATFTAEDSGLFEKELTGLGAGLHAFSIFAEDTDGRRSVTIGFSIGLIDGTTTTISGIFISPTIAISPTQVERGGKVNILGQVFPQSQVDIFISSEEIVKETRANARGRWSYILDTSSLEEREHGAKAKGLFGDGEQSSFSNTLPFLVLEPGSMVCRGADLNFDDRVNIVDFSILLYFWAQINPSNRCADINFDGIVDIVDFSIMMYWWGG